MNFVEKKAEQTHYSPPHPEKGVDFLAQRLVNFATNSRPGSGGVKPTLLLVVRDINRDTTDLETVAIQFM
jgi:hypothetical protein